MKLGTHNSLTYHSPQWWVRPLNFIGQCQSLTIEQQYEMGVRYFDFRLRYDKNGRYAAHGFLSYKKIAFDYIFGFLNRKGDCLVQLILENHFWEESKGEEKFYDDVFLLKRTYPNIRFTGGQKKRVWRSVVFLPQYPLKRCFEGFEGKELKFPYPKKYAKKNNARYWQEVDDEAYSLFDFIEIR